VAGEACRRRWRVDEHVPHSRVVRGEPSPAGRPWLGAVHRGDGPVGVRAHPRSRGPPDHARRPRLLGIGGADRLRRHKIEGRLSARRAEAAAAQSIPRGHHRLAGPRRRYHLDGVVRADTGPGRTRTGLWTASLHVVAWSGASVAAAYLSRHVRRPMQGSVPIAVGLVAVAVGQVLGYGSPRNSARGGWCRRWWWRGWRPACSTHCSAVRRSRASITLVVVVAAHVGTDLAAGWNVAVPVSTGISLVGAAFVALAGRTPRLDAVACATNGA
jgi:hypothetical protein